MRPRVVTFYPGICLGRIKAIRQSLRITKKTNAPLCLCVTNNYHSVLGSTRVTENEETALLPVCCQTVTWLVWQSVTGDCLSYFVFDKTWISRQQITSAQKHTLSKLYLTTRDSLSQYYDREGRWVGGEVTLPEQTPHTHSPSIVLNIKLNSNTQPPYTPPS
jgi:hypothetical protein